MQCQSDRLYHYYHDQEKKLLKSSQRLRTSIKTAGAHWSFTEDADSLKTAESKKLERQLLGDIKKLGEFLRESKRNLIEVLEKFDDFHGTSVKSTELATLEETHAFLDLGRLEYLNERVVQIIISAEEGLNQQQQVVEQSPVVSPPATAGKYNSHFYFLMISCATETLIHVHLSSLQTEENVAINFTHDTKVTEKTVSDAKQVRRPGKWSTMKRRLSTRSMTESGKFSSKSEESAMHLGHSLETTKSWAERIRSRRAGRRESVGALAIHQIELMMIDQGLQD